VRILIAHSRYLSGWTSGENSVVRDEERLLTEAGHDVTTWTPAPEPEGSRARLGASAIWSRSAVAKVRDLINDHRPEIVHLHNLFPMLSPAVLRAATDAGSKVVMTLHNYRLSCLPATFMRDGEVCELCLGRLPWRGVMYRCYRGSLPGSAALAGSLGLHRAIRSFDRVSLFLPVSHFLKEKHIEAGLPADRMYVKPNFCWPMPRRTGLGEYFLYAGRLSPEKDVATLLDGWRAIREPLIVVGDGPERHGLERSAPRNVEFRGSVTPEEVTRLLGAARALVFPSRWYEGAPRSIIEAYAAGVPVIGTAIGGVAELIEDGVSGLLIPPRSIEAWTDAVERFMQVDGGGRLSDGAFDAWLRTYSPTKGLEALERAYEFAVTGREREHQPPGDERG
jgi:glycosyltransferase involved in cell wall biosynthesis